MTTDPHAKFICVRCRRDVEDADLRPTGCANCVWDDAHYPPFPMAVIFRRIERERARQDAKFGEQNHDFGRWLAILHEEIGEACKSHLDGDSRAVQGELLHAAAVLVNWLEGVTYRAARDRRERP